MSLEERAVTPPQKREIIERLYALWLQHPDMRLTQMVRNLYDDRDIYHIEDFRFVQELEDFYQASDKGEDPWKSQTIDQS